MSANPIDTLSTMFGGDVMNNIGGSGGGSHDFMGSFLFSASSVLSGNDTLFWSGNRTDQYIKNQVQYMIVNYLPSFLVNSTIFQFFLSSFFLFFLGNQIFSAGIALLIASSIWKVIEDKLYVIYYFFRDFFVCSLEIKEKENYRYNTIYLCLISWMSENPNFESAKHFTVHAKCDLSDSYRNKEQHESDVQLVLAPGPGSHTLNYKGYRVTIQRQDPTNDNDPDSNNKKGDIQKLVLSVNAWNGKKVLHDLVEEAVKAYFQSAKGVTSIYTMSDNYYSDWQKLCDRPNRSFDTVYIDEKVKNNLLKDLDRFMNNEHFYRENGLNFQRGYLLYGHPGTGKTSLILAVAAYLQCSVFTLSLSDKSLDDTKLMALITQIPRRGIILLEDIDAAFNDNRKASEDVQRVTFSGLLNALDGVTSHSQFPRIIFMTTNHINRLEPALIRPGRIDMKIEFEYSTSGQIYQMANRFFKNETLASKISKLFPEQKLTTAEVQTYLMRFIYEPEDCLLHVEEYLEEVEDLRKKLAKKEEDENKKEEEVSQDKNNSKDEALVISEKE
nr:unnamed protein product [Naegleria fowleri]